MILKACIHPAEVFPSKRSFHPAFFSFLERVLSLVVPPDTVLLSENAAIIRNVRILVTILIVKNLYYLISYYPLKTYVNFSIVIYLHANFKQF